MTVILAKKDFKSNFYLTFPDPEDEKLRLSDCFDAARALFTEGWTVTNMKGQLYENAVVVFGDLVREE